MAKKMKCRDCRFPIISEAASDKQWMAFVCGNPKSDCHKSFLNISMDGNKQHYLCWSGCEHGERRVKV